MNKKQLIALVQSMVLSVVATANKEAQDGDPITEDEARVLLGSLVLRKEAKRLVASAVRCETEDVVWVDAPVKAKKKAEESTDEDTDDTES